MHSSSEPQLYPFDPNGPRTEWLPAEIDNPADHNWRNLYGKNVLYRFFDANRRLLYIGVTNWVWGPPERWAGHQKASVWWRHAAFLALELIPPGTDRLVVERNAIRSERPQYNHVHNRKRVQLTIRLDEGTNAIVDTLRYHLFPEDFAALAEAFAAEAGFTQDL